VGPRTGLEDVEKRKFLTLSGLKLRPLRRPARSQSLYRLSYPGSHRPCIATLKRVQRSLQRNEETMINVRFQRGNVIIDKKIQETMNISG
jgi:hypothetical protein